MARDRNVKLSCRSPSECTAEEIARFSQLVCQAFGSRDRTEEIARARVLVFLREGEELAGVAALKMPTDTKRRAVFRSAGVSPAEGAAPCELGWVVVDERFRGRLHSRRLVECALRAAADADVFATSHDANAPMHRTLRRFGFVPVGNRFYSRQHERKLVLFVRRCRPTGA